MGERVKIRITPLDKLFSEYIRRRAISGGGCEWCGKPKFDIQKEDGSVLPAWKQLETAHYIKRRYKKVRYDEDNAIGVCKMGCHQAFEDNKETFMMQRLGQERLDMLRKRAQTIYKPDINLITLYLKERIKEVENVTNDI